MAEEREHSSSKGVIPYFFYDVISFIIPGASLFIGAFLVLFGKDWSKAVCGWLKPGNPHEASIAALSIILGIAFLLFLGVASAVGFLLSTISYQILDRFCWGHFAKLTFAGLMKFGGSSRSNQRLIRAYNENFGIELNEDVNIDRASTVCEYYIWSRSQSLGVMASRFDAEKILSQSLALVSVLLLAECWTWQYSLPTIIVLFCCTVASLVAFHYHRKKRVYGRFQIFLVLSADKEDSGRDRT